MRDLANEAGVTVATLYNRFGIDTTETYPDHSGRPIPILPNGTPITELL